MEGEATRLERLALVRSFTAGGTARAIRLAARLSLAEVAGAVSVHPTTVYKWELGVRKPTGDAGLRYLEVLEGLMERRHG